MFGIGSTELLIILLVALLIFGPQRLPELARMIAKGLNEVRRAVDDIKSQVEMEETLQKHPELLAEEPTPTIAARPADDAVPFDPAAPPADSPDSSGDDTDDD